MSPAPTTSPVPTPTVARMRTRDLPRLLLGKSAAATIPGAAVRSWCRSWMGAGMALIVLCLAVYLPGLWSIPPVDRDESRFAQASRTMLESGDYIVPQIGNTPRLNKPPLIYWLQSASAAILGDAPGTDGMGQWGNGNIWVFRLPSVLCAIGTVLLTWRLGLKMFDPRAAALAAAVLAVCPMVIWDAHQARADQLLLFTTTGAMFALFVCWRQAFATSPERSDGLSTGGTRSSKKLTSFAARSGPVLALWLFIALGILAKGPITPMIAALTAITLSITSRDARWLLRLRPILGLIIITALVAPWVYLIVQRIGWDTYWSTIKAETLGRSTSIKEDHWGPPGYHLILLAALFWPGSLMTAAALTRAWKRGLPRFRLRNRPEAFLLAWIVPSWIVFEIIATKLPHYTMPLYPAIALLTARAVCAAAAGTLPFARSILDRIGVIIWGGIGIAGLIGSLGLFVEVGGFDFTSGGAGRPFLGVTAAALFTAIGVAVWLAIRHRAFAPAHVLGGLAMVLWCWVTLAWVAPRCEQFWVSSKLIAYVHDRRWTTESRSVPIALIDYQEPSAMFLFRGRAEPVEWNSLPTWLKAHPTAAVIVSHVRDVREMWDLGPRFGPVSQNSVAGYNYSTGRQVDLRIHGLPMKETPRLPRSVP